jgi:hypothetical protein
LILIAYNLLYTSNIKTRVISLKIALRKVLLNISAILKIITLNAVLAILPEITLITHESYITTAIIIIINTELLIKLRTARIIRRIFPKYNIRNIMLIDICIRTAPVLPALNIENSDILSLFAYSQLYVLDIIN